MKKHLRSGFVESVDFLRIVERIRRLVKEKTQKRYEMLFKKMQICIRKGILGVTLKI